MVADTRVVQPESPPQGWGVTPRKRVLKDFKFVIIWSFVTISLTVFLIAPQLFGVYELGQDYRVTLYIALAILFFITLAQFGDPGRVAREADVEADIRCKEWIKNVLKPFLEEKYGVKFTTGLGLYSWGNPRAVKDERTIEVAIRGVRVYRSSFIRDYDSATWGYLDVQLEDEVWMEEVIRPKEVSYRRLDPEN